jgi:dTDP-4-amino-4,6-dideoxygalactose transaminase
MLNTPFSSWPSFTEEEGDIVKQVLLSNKVNYWTGVEGRKFEEEFAHFVGTDHAVALANGTVALDMALNVLDVGEGDEVIVTPRTFIASVSSIVNAGATPVFADVERDSQNISAATIEAVLTSRTKAVICVHHSGWPCEMAPIMTLAKMHDLKIIEDCAQAHGALYKQKSVGSIGNIGCWSFCQDKIMTTGGEGGMVTTNNPELWSKMWSFKDHGKSWEAVYEREYTPGFRWLHESFGTNWRMTEMQAAIGRIQLKRMPNWHLQRKKNAGKILETAKSLSGLQIFPIPEYIGHAWYKCYLLVKPKTLKTGWNRDRILQEILNLRVPCFPGTCPEVYLEKAFESTGWRPQESLPIAKTLGEDSLMFLVHPTLKDHEIQLTCDVLTKVMERATKFGTPDFYIPQVS